MRWIIGHPSMPHSFVGLFQHNGSQIQHTFKVFPLWHRRAVFVLLATLLLCGSCQEYGEYSDGSYDSQGGAQYSEGSQYAADSPDYTEGSSQTCPQVSETQICFCNATEIDCSHLELLTVPSALGSSVQRL